jgi:hypothetical protein
VNRALSRGHYKLAFIVIQEQMTFGHSIRTELAPTKAGESVISLHTFMNEAGTLLAYRGIRFRGNPVSPNGRYIFRREPGQATVGPIGPLEEAYFEPDPIAVRALSEMARSLMASGTKVIYIQLPVYRPLYEANQSSFEQYTKQIRMDLPPAPFVDFDDVRYKSISSDPNNFANPKHLNPTGAAKIQKVLEPMIP